MPDKRGLSLYAVMFAFFRMFILMAVVFAVVFLIRLFIVSTVDISEAESEILFNNLVSSPHALAYTDPITHRTYPRKISITEFSDTLRMEDKLEATFSSDKPAIGARCSLTNISGGQLAYDGKQVLPVYYNRDRYSKWVELAKTKAKGVGGAKERLIRQDVILIWDGKEVPAMLEVSVVVPNS